MTELVNLPGASGATYAYEAAPMASAWYPVAANYAFAEQMDGGRWRVLYIGQTRDLRGCLAHHGLWAEATSYGCTHVLAHANPDGVQARWLEEHDLIEGLEPPMNGLQARRQSA